MLKKILIFFCLLLVCPCFGEVVLVSNTFYYYHKDTGLYCTFLQNKYIISVLQSLTDDMVLELPLSVGTYVKSKDSYQLTDAFTGIVMNARQENEKLSFFTGFEVLIENQLTQKKPYYDRTFDEYFERRAEPLVDIEGVLRIGIAGLYSSGGRNIITSLNLFENNRFELHLYDLPLLSGTWEQSGQDVILMSSTINKPLRLLMTNDGLYCSCMFGYLDGSALIQRKAYGAPAPVPEERETLCEKKIVIFSIIAVICLCIILLCVRFWQRR